MAWAPRSRSDFAGLSAIVAGKGPQVLMIHGVGLRAEAWGRQIDGLSDRYRCVAPDLPGHGHSPMPAGNLTLRDYSDAIATRMDAPALVIGHSMGAMIALDLANRFPDRVSGVVALNAIFERSATAERAVKTRADSLDGVSLADPTATLERWFGEARSPERDACRDWLNTVDPAAYRMAYRVFATENGPARSALTALNCPALFMTGRDEPNSTADMSRAMAALTPNARAIIVPDAAHMMPMTHSAAVNAGLSDFAQKVRA